jgi:hypothetical protein
MITRLHSKYPELAEAILAASHDRIQQTVKSAGQLAVENARLEGSLLDAAVAAIERREHLRPELRTRLEEMQRRLDDRYLDVLGSLGVDQKLPADALDAFHRARALSAVLGSLEDDVDGAAATDVVYEAIASSSDESDIVATVSQVPARATS